MTDSTTDAEAVEMVLKWASHGWGCCGNSGMDKNADALMARGEALIRATLDSPESAERI